MADGQENEFNQTTKSKRSKNPKTNCIKSSEQKTKSPAKKSIKKKKSSLQQKTPPQKKTAPQKKTPKTNDSIRSNVSILDLAYDDGVKSLVEEEELAPIRFNTSRPKRKKRKITEMPSSSSKKTKKTETKSTDSKKTKNTESQSTDFREESPLEAETSTRNAEYKTSLTSKKTKRTKSPESTGSLNKESSSDSKKAKTSFRVRNAETKSLATSKKTKKTKSKSSESTKSTDSDDKYALDSPTISLEELMESKERDQEIRMMEDISAVAEPNDTINLEEYGNVSLEDVK